MSWNPIALTFAPTMTCRSGIPEVSSWDQSQLCGSLPSGAPTVTPTAVLTCATVNSVHALHEPKHPLLALADVHAPVPAPPVPAPPPPSPLPEPPLEHAVPQTNTTNQTNRF